MTALTRLSSVTMAIAAVVVLPAIVLAQTPVQLNVPYRCEDGVTRTITRCEKNARAEVCFWREEENGQVTERYNVRGQMDGWLKMCTPQPAKPAAAPAPPVNTTAKPTAPPAVAQPRAPETKPGATSAARPEATAVGRPDRRNDPTAVATRRCLELGGSELECLGKGLSAGLGVESILPKSTARGVRLGGTFKTAAGITLAFDTDRADISACDRLVGQSQDYSVTRRGEQLQVEISTAPKPLIVMLGPDGRISGPAAFDLAGQVIVGYNTYWVESRTTNNVVVPAHEERVPVYEPRTARCSFSAMRATGPTTPDVTVGLIPGLSPGLAPGLFGPPADSAAQKPDIAEAPAGPRFAGTYTGTSGLRLEFRSTSVIADCKDVKAVLPYAVQNRADGLAVTVRPGNAPFTLTVRPDGTLTSAGSIEVTGRVLTGTDANGVTFATRTASCAAGVLAPQ